MQLTDISESNQRDQYFKAAFLSRNILKRASVVDMVSLELLHAIVSQTHTH